ncbi:MAG: carbon-nitrogen family hydrolase, partial [Candidatus Omnitrophica bacterium]|nr:carbon-nitrogen family hydrolase [Candidatus Omnitrophota bacterium]
HLFSPSGESYHHTPGSKIGSFRIGSTNITPFICYDLRFAPLFWLAAAKTDVYTIIANWPISRRNHWKTLLVARAIENQAFVIGVNRLGISPKSQYCGDSCIVDPWGNIVFDACCEEGAFVCKIDISKVRQTRLHFPVLNDRKSFAEYEKLLENE